MKRQILLLVLSFFTISSLLFTNDFTLKANESSNGQSTTVEVVATAEVETKVDEQQETVVE